MSATQPDWVPDEYDPEAPLLERLYVIAEIDGEIELHVRGDNNVVEIVGQPVDYRETPRGFHMKCGNAVDDWEWEINVPKKEGVPPTLDRVNPHQSVEAYEATKSHWLRIADIRIFGVDVARYFEGS